MSGTDVCRFACVANGRKAPGYDRLVPTAYYDGVAAWYDEHLVPGPELVEVVRRLVGPGSGRCLDLCCGTGFHLTMLHELGWTVTGIDISEDQLRLARSRAGDSAELLQGDAADLPFADRSFDLVFSAFTHTDVGDFEAVVAEAVRVLAPGGRLVYAGPHRASSGRTRASPKRWASPSSTRATATAAATPRRSASRRPACARGSGAVHLPLGDLLQAFLGAGLRIEAFEEPVCPPREYPHWFALRAAP